MRELRAAVAVLSLMVCVWGAAAAAAEEEAEDCSFASLFKHLNLNDKTDPRGSIRPVRNWTTPTRVWVNLLVYGIIEVVWKNEFLRWNPERFCGIYNMEVPRGMTWEPDIVIQEDISESGAARSSSQLSLSPNGTMMGMMKRALKVTCQMNLYQFPADVQHCNHTFSTFSQLGIAVYPLEDSESVTSVSETYMSTNGEWEMTSISVILGFELYSGNKLQKLTYQLTLKRRPMLYIINCILPLLFFLMLDVGTFFLSEARGEKLSLKVTLLLSVSVLLLILQDILPSTSDQLPLIAQYSIVIFSLMALSLMEAMLVSFLLDLDSCPAKPSPTKPEPAPAPSCVATETTMEAAQSEPSQEKPEEEQGEKEGHQDLFLLNLILKEVKSARQEVPSEVPAGDRKLGSYSRLAMKIDIIFFWVYVIFNVAFLIYIYIVWRF